MKICCLSDIHGNLPEIPDCDLLLLGGDLVPLRNHRVDSAKGWLEQVFKGWVNDLSQRMKIIAVAGNHDFIFQRAPQLVPKMDWVYLQDSGVDFGGLKIWGSPWQPTFFDWAFNLDESDLKRKWDFIPDDTDILLLHGPPYGCGDLSSYQNVNTGSPSLAKRILEINPELVVAGHIHEGYGHHSLGNTIVINASHVDENYNPVNPPILLGLDV